VSVVRSVQDVISNEITVSVIAGDHSSERRQHCFRIDSLSRALPAFDNARPSGRECSIGHDEIENRIAIEDERALLVDRKVFNPVLVEHALQIDGSTERPLVR
jgi:hypothetical protein